MNHKKDVNDKSNFLIYKPENNDSKLMKQPFGVKFSEDVFIYTDLLHKWSIPYSEEDLENTIYGKVMRVKRNKL
jgi:hypothetical protein